MSGSGASSGELHSTCDFALRECDDVASGELQRCAVRKTVGLADVRDASPAILRAA